ncbi:hypothetical protein R4K89_02860 [Brachyspira intermedia]|uniref:hypothetical protein n=1 Tax=Brachyspira intermedia TaxID=84377 RepID=UPI003006C292
MNKKLFTLFLVVAASAIFAVSCNNKTTDPIKNPNTGTTTESTPTGGDGATASTPTTPTVEKKISLKEVEDAIKKLGKVDASSDKGSIDFSSITLDKASTVTAIAKKGTSLSSGALKTAIESAKNKVKLDNAESVTFDTAKVTGTEKTVSFTIKVKAKSGYTFDGFTSGVAGEELTVTVTVNGKNSAGSSDENFEA